MKKKNDMSTTFAPIHPDICGSSWQVEYYDLVNKACENLQSVPVADRRLLLSFAVRAGPADNYFGEHNHCFDVEIVYHPSTFDWTGGEKLNLSERHYQCLLPPYNGQPGHLHLAKCLKSGPLFPTDSSNSSFVDIDYVNEQLHKFRSGDISQVAYRDILLNTSNINVVEIISNRGFVHSFFDNPLYTERLHQMGLKQDTAFSCLFNYLFKFNDNVCTRNPNCMKAELAILKARKQDIITISVQIRFAGNYEADFLCSEKLADEYRAENKQVIFVLITDDLPTQTWAKEKYKDSVVLPSWTPQQPEAVMGALEKTKEHRKQSVIDAARDMYISSLADVHVVTQYSGFGLVAALMRVRPADEIRIHQLGSQCTRKQAVPLAHFASIWSGL